MLEQQSNSLFSQQILLSYGFSAGLSTFEAHNEREKEKKVEHNMSIDPSSNVKDCRSQ